MNYFSLVISVVIVVGFLALKHFLEKKFGSASVSVEYSSYAKKDRLMNDSELAFFVSLKQALGERFLIFPKVRIEDFVGVKEGLEYGKKNGLRNRIKSNHVDFLVCDRATTAPLLAVEVDGKSHERPNRINRDDFVGTLYESVGLPLCRVKVGNDFQAEAEKIRKILDGDRSNVD